MTRHPLLLLVAALAVVITACASSSDPSAPYFPSNHINANAPPVVDGTATGAVSSSVVVRGAIARPNPALTPGVVAVNDLLAVCKQPRHIHIPVSALDQLAVFNAYKIGPDLARKYGLDYLVPLQLGGSPVQANIWPVPIRGVGFREKESLNARLRVAVCRGDIPLGLAQDQIAKDWFSLWVRYGS